MQKIVFLIVVATVIPGVQAHANDLQTCAAISDAAERLFCYDHLASGGTPIVRPKTPTIPAASVGQASSASNTPPATVQPVANTSSNSPKSSTRQPTVVLGSDDSFGMEQEIARQGPDEIRSRYVGYFEGSSGRGTKFTLENGQIWEQTGTGRLTKKGEGVIMIVERGSLGSYKLSVDGSNRSVRVKRLK